MVLACTAAACSGGNASASTHARTTHGSLPDRLVAPPTTPVEDTKYLTDVAKADPTLATYVQQQGNVALKSMLTDGSAFCAFLRRGGGIDAALVDVVVGARTVESQTKLPTSVTTYNTIEAVALVDLCPKEQALVPAPVRTRLRRLTKDLDASAVHR
jgi:hypothetical protein